MKKSNKQILYIPKVLSLLISILLILPHMGNSQNFWNTDFEYGVYKSQPRKWSIEGEGENYSAKLDSNISKNGNKSLFISIENAEVFIFLSVPGNLIAGKTIQMEAYIKSQSADSLQTMLIFHNPGGRTTIPSQANNLKDEEWQLISHKASFPENYSSDRLLIALTANGTGRFWFDQVQIKIDGQEYGNGKPDFSEPIKSEIEVLNKRIIPIETIEINSDLKDLKPLSKIVGNSRIVALGENSHGSSSIFKLKLRLVKYLVEQEGFSIFALETPMVEADNINEYVLYGKGTIDDVLNNLIYPSWQTQEMIDIIQWMKFYNQNNNKKLEFRGFDMQNGLSALKAVKGFAQNNDADLLAKLIEIEDQYNNPSKKEQLWKSIYQKSEEVYNYLESKKYSSIEVKDFMIIKHYMNIFLQSISLNYQTEKTKSRDAYMAENIDWILKSSGDDSKIIISADNTHITKATGKMGELLSNWYGEKYLAFGFTYNKGSYSAYGPEKFYEVHPSYAGTYEYFFSKSKFKNFILDIRNINDIPILSQPAGFRSIGSRPQETTQFAEINMKKHFDVIVYLEKSDHTYYLKK